MWVEKMETSCARSRGLYLLTFMSLTVFSRTASSQTTNPTDLSVIHETMYSINFEYDWDTYFPDPCVSGPQGIVCTPDAATGVLFVTQMQFGYISPIANLIPCSANATVPDSIAKLTRLDTLSFYNCFMHPESPVSIPKAITELGGTLRLLSFSGNTGLTGSIPEGIGNLTGLQRLVLSQNALSGAIPASLSHLPSLLQLDLSHNLLNGPIPAALFSSLPSLLNLDLRYNALSGPLNPPLIPGSLRNLQRLALSYNALTGPLPPNLGTSLGPSLTFLDLSHNNITGPLPASLGSALPNLEDLFLNSNAIEGAIPDSLGMLTKLVRLDLSSCAFGSSIPEGLAKMESLRYLSASNNGLVGGIPRGLGLLPRLFTLNLDGNRLSGPVPFDAGFVRKMGRNLRLEGNEGLCCAPQLLVLVKPGAPLGLRECDAQENQGDVAAAAAAGPPPGVAPVGGGADSQTRIPNAGGGRKALGLHGLIRWFPVTMAISMAAWI